MNMPKIDVKILKEQQKENFRQRVAFTRMYAKKLREGEIEEEDLNNITG